MSTAVCYMSVAQSWDWPDDYRKNGKLLNIKLCNKMIKLNGSINQIKLIPNTFIVNIIPKHPECNNIGNILKRYVMSHVISVKIAFQENSSIEIYLCKFKCTQSSTKIRNKFTLTFSYMKIVSMLCMDLL